MSFGVSIEQRLMIASFGHPCYIPVAFAWAVTSLCICSLFVVVEYCELLILKFETRASTKPKPFSSKVLNTSAILCVIQLECNIIFNYCTY